VLGGRDESAQTQGTERDEHEKHVKREGGQDKQKAYPSREAERRGEQRGRQVHGQRQMVMVWEQEAMTSLCICACFPTHRAWRRTGLSENCFHWNYYIDTVDAEDVEGCEL
jgi:hypothetical protein